MDAEKTPLEMAHLHMNNDKFLGMNLELATIYAAIAQAEALTRVAVALERVLQIIEYRWG